MFRSMIANLALLTAFLFIFNQIYYSYLIKKNAISVKVWIGLLHGVCGSLLLLFSFRINETVYIDFRHIAIISAAFFGGAVSSCIAAGILILVRAVSFGDLTVYTLIAMTTLTLNGIGSGLVMRYCADYWRKWQVSLVLITSTIALTAILKKTDPAYTLLYISLLALGGFFAAGLIRVFSRHHQLSEELTTSEKRYRALHSLQEAVFDSLVGTVITVVDREGRITRINKAAERMLGYTVEELLGRSPFLFHAPEEINDFVHPSYRLSDFVSGILTEGKEFTYVRKDGARLTVLLHVSELWLGQEGVGYVFLATDISERKEMEDRLYRLSMIDGLTGATNRRYFDEALAQEWEKAIASGRCGHALILFDIDRFKAYNDIYGHPAGDACLIRVAEIVRNTLNNPDYTISRYGGEEFAVILPSTNESMALEAAESLRLAVFEAQIPHEGSTNGGVLTISVGVAGCVHPQSSSPDALVSMADRALYHSKACGRNQVSGYREFAETV